MTEHIKSNLLVPYIAIAFIILAFMFQPLDAFVDGFFKIQTSESILLTDYVAVGGIGPALFNSGFLMLISYLFIRKIDLRITGSIFAGIFTIGGFAFFGKNIINVLIIYFGVLLYAKYKKINIKEVIVVFLFSTGLSPISSLVMFGVGIPLIYSIPLGVFTGILAGFILVELSSRVIAFHRGYDLYNVGFASGVLSLAFFSVFRLVGLEYETNLIYTNDQHIPLLILIIIICVIYLVLGIILGDIKEYDKITSQSGRAVTDFTRRDNQGLTMFNIGITGLGALSVLLLLNVNINGPVFGGLFTIIGFAAFGKHIKNAIPPMIGVFLISYIFNLDLSVGVVMAIIFSTGLAPVAGEYGVIIGIITGMLHLPVATSLGQLHGGVLLYANGFAAAFTAVIITTFIASFKRSEK